MKFKKILMIGFLETDLDKKNWETLDRLCEERVILPRDSNEIQTHLSTCDCLLLKLGMAADQKAIDSAPNLRYIGMFGTGVGNIDTKYAAQKNVAVCNLYYATEAVAELAFGLTLEYLREIARAKTQSEVARLKDTPLASDFSEASYQGSEIRGKTFGIIGLGKIGSRIAEIAKNGFHADVRYWSINRKPEYESQGIRYQAIEELLEECEVISLNLAHISGQTTHFLNEERIGKIKKGAIVVNLSPMELVDISALETRLGSGDTPISFILDHSDELSSEEIKTLAKYKNCVMYPPIGYTTKEASVVKKKVFVENLENFLAGNPSNKIN